MTEVIINHGVLEGRKDTDYVAGENSPLGYEVNIPSGDWTPHVPTPETQWGTGGDKMNCVTQSFHNQVEAELIFQMKVGTMPISHLQFLSDNGFLDSNGHPNFNDRISAILNETTHDGNWLYKVADTARKVGLFPETMLPSDENLSWSEYYDKSKITPEMLALGKKFLEYFDITYEWVNVTAPELTKHLKQAPLQVVIPGHAVVEITNPDPLKYFDTYNPFIKSTPLSKLSSALKTIIKPKEIKPMFPIKKVKINGAHGVLIDTPNGAQIIKATSEEIWRSWSKQDSYRIHSVNSDSSTDWSVDLEINY
jgi:hypothetical protein